jgi:hypothetical protein
LKNILLRPRTAADIEAHVEKVVRGLGNPEPPLDLRVVRDLLELDRGYFSAVDDSVLRETVHRLKVAGRQVLRRPTLLLDVVRRLELKALYLPDRKRILLDESLPLLKHRWNEAHEIGHDIIPWHEGMMLGDTLQTLTAACHHQIEAEANYAAGQLLFLGPRFLAEANAVSPTIANIRQLSGNFGNTFTSTLWRYVELAHPLRPMVALITDHPHAARRKLDFDATDPCRYCIESPAFRMQFGSQYSSVDLFALVASYCGAQRGGTLGESPLNLVDCDGVTHEFHFETFFNRYDALTLGVWRRARRSARSATRSSRMQ